MLGRKERREQASFQVSFVEREQTSSLVSIVERDQTSFLVSFVERDQTSFLVSSVADEFRLYLLGVSLWEETVSFHNGQFTHSVDLKHLQTLFYS